MTFPSSRRDLLLAAAGLAAAGLRAQSPANAQLDRLLSLFDFESDAHTRVSHGAWERISGAAADEITLRWNREAYDHIRLKPRILMDVSKLDTRVKLFGQELPFPWPRCGQLPPPTDWAQEKSSSS